MKWHAERLKSTGTTIFRGYKQGSYEAASPYSAIMVVVTRRNKHTINGFVSDGKIKKKDIIRLRRLCLRMGLRIGTTRRHGSLKTFGV